MWQRSNKLAAWPASWADLSVRLKIRWRCQSPVPRRRRLPPALMSARPTRTCSGQFDSLQQLIDQISQLPAMSSSTPSPIGRDSLKAQQFWRTYARRTKQAP